VISREITRTFSEVRFSLSRVDTLLSQGNFAREEKKAAIARGLFYVAELMLG
jgi:hypothetical protein